MLLNLSVSATRGGPDVWEQMVTIGKEQHQEFSRLITGRLQITTDIQPLRGWMGGGFSWGGAGQGCVFSNGGRNDNKSTERWQIREVTHILLPALLEGSRQGLTEITKSLPGLADL